ncbi:MAG: EAL domain-containing protein [Candidatus Thiodiazotropha sp.]|nr:EAL domain-containing protein [Candidatus Thiodiazotropha sp.]MCM8881835.1 EAL domain-containing protein [Candidatus Thiodiazotropha sp.]MCM8918496.1 EAL domain-containing protein [Candidatus Thiodiazotropha sp.]
MFNPIIKKIGLGGVFLVVALILFAYTLVNNAAIQRIDHLLYDYFLNLQGNQVSSEIVIVAIDDPSLHELGRWPWSRRIHADLLNRLTDMDARVVAFDVLFAEPEVNDLQADRLFASAIERNGNTVLAVAPSNSMQNTAITEVLPLTMLAESAAGMGHVDIEIDSDGLCRSFYMHAGINDARWPTFSLAALQVTDETMLADVENRDTPTSHTTSSWLRHGRFLIPFDPRSDAVETLSAYQVLSDDEIASRVKGRYVLIGSTATGLGDVVSTPVSRSHQRMPGVELNAHVLSGLLKGSLIREMNSVQYLVLTLLLTGIATLMMVTTSFPAAILLFLATITGIPALAGLLLFGGHIWFAPAAAVAPLIVGFPLWGTWSHLHEKRINRSLSDRMHHQALHHAATDLPNLYVLEESLRSLSNRDPFSRKIAVLMIIHIKWSGSAGGIVGRSAGDQLLRAIAQRLRDVVRSNDLVTHLSGDDFGVLVNDLTDTESAHYIARNLLNALQEPLVFEDEQIFLDPRMGLSLWPKESPDGEALLRDANIAMFRARIQQSNATCVYSTQIAKEVQERSQLEQALISAMERNEFEVYYQPQVVTESGRVIGVEALLRWHNPELGLVYPGTFIPVAEHTGLIRAIGGWVLRTACNQVQQWNERGFGPLRLAVNLSPLQFTDQNLVAEVRATLESSGLDPRSLELEITESTVMQNMQEATTAMRLLKEQGVKLAIDDFGTGYSSLSNLQHFPLDRIKIDQSFTREFQNNDHAREITLTIINMAKRLKLEVIAEGVETESQAAFLGEYGCDELQGYYFSHPLPAAELATLLGESSASGGTSSQIGPFGPNSLSGTAAIYKR